MIKTITVFVIKISISTKIIINHMIINTRIVGIIFAIIIASIVHNITISAVIAIVINVINLVSP